MLSLQDVINMYDKGQLILKKFYGHIPRLRDSVDEACLSNWYLSDFTVAGTSYNCIEQYMMAQKALMFEESNPEYNRAIYSKIMSSSNPSDIKRLGRAVFGFERAIWDSQIPDIMLVGLEAKFTQNTALKEYLLGCPTGCVFVEASPYDAIWGIKLNSDHPSSDNPLLWQGENRLGFLLTAVRDKIAR